MVLTSAASMKVLLIEANVRKQSKYQEKGEAVPECARCEPIEVGCRGFAGRSTPFVASQDLTNGETPP